MHGDKVGTAWERPLDLDLVECAADLGQDLAASEQGGPEGHEVRHGMMSISYELMKNARYESLAFGVLDYI